MRCVLIIPIKTGLRAPRDSATFDFKTVVDSVLSKFTPIILKAGGSYLIHHQQYPMDILIDYDISEQYVTVTPKQKIEGADILLQKSRLPHLTGMPFVGNDYMIYHILWWAQVKFPDEEQGLLM